VPGVKGGTNIARPVVSVVTLSPSDKTTLTPGVSRPFTSNTASVERSPVTNLRGSSKMRAPEGAGAAGCWAKLPAEKQTTTTIAQRARRNTGEAG